MRLLRPLTLEDASRSAFAAVRPGLKSPRWLPDLLVYQSRGRSLLHSNHRSPPFALGPVAGISSSRQPDLRRPRVPISAAHRHVRLSDAVECRLRERGFSDLLTPFLGAAGVEAGATGWW